MRTIERTKQLKDRKSRRFGALTRMLSEPAMRVLLASILLGGASLAQAQNGNRYPFSLEAYDENGIPVVAEIYWKSSQYQSAAAISNGKWGIVYPYTKLDALYGSTLWQSQFIGAPRDPLCGQEVAIADGSLSYDADYTPGGFGNHFQHNDNAYGYGGTVGMNVCWSMSGSPFDGGAGRPITSRIFSGSARNAAGEWLVFDHIAEPLVTIFNDCSPEYDIRGPAVTVINSGGFKALDYPEPEACEFTITAQAIYRYVADGPDTDSDQIPDADDNCPGTANQRQNDADQDGIGDLCDGLYVYDYDLDGVMDAADNCPQRSNSDQKNLDGDDLGNVCDPDMDGDGFVNEEGPDAAFLSYWDINAQADNCPLINNPDQTDSDGDGRGDACQALPPGC